MKRFLLNGMVYFLVVAVLLALALPHKALAGGYEVKFRQEVRGKDGDGTISDFNVLTTATATKSGVAVAGYAGNYFNGHYTLNGGSGYIDDEWDSSTNTEDIVSDGDNTIHAGSDGGGKAELNNAMLTIYNSAGKVVRQKTFTDYDVYIYDSVVVSGGNYIVAGHSRSADGSGNSMLHVVSHDKNLNVKWKKDYDASSGFSSKGVEIIPADNNRVIVHGCAGDSAVGDMAGLEPNRDFVMMYDSSGNVTSKRSFDKNIFSIVPVSGGYIALEQETAINTDENGLFTNTSAKNYISRYDNDNSVKWTREVLSVTGGEIASIASNGMDIMIAGNVKSGDAVKGTDRYKGYIQNYDINGNYTGVLDMASHGNFHIYHITEGQTSGNTGSYYAVGSLDSDVALGQRTSSGYLVGISGTIPDPIPLPDPTPTPAPVPSTNPNPTPSPSYPQSGNSDNSTKMGWQQSGGTWFFYYDNAPIKGWAKVNGVLYYFDKTTGAMRTGWINDGGWYYMKSNGAMTTGWQQISGTWYYLGSNGKMQTGWQQIGSDWYYLNSNGAMKTGWVQSGAYWYYLKTNGAMARHWQQIGSSWYCFDEGGRMLTGNWYINGTLYRFGSNGVWTGR